MSASDSYQHFTSGCSRFDSHFWAMVIILLDVSSFFANAQGPTGMTYAVQLMISAKPLATSGPLFYNVPAVHEERLDTGFAYVTATESDVSKAISLQKDLKAKGFKFASVVAYKKGKRIPFNPALAEKLLSHPAPVLADTPNDDASDQEYSSPVFIFIR